MLGRGGGSGTEGETRFHATPHHRQERASPGIKGTAVISTAIPALRDLQGKGSKPLHLFLFSATLEVVQVSQIPSKALPDWCWAPGGTAAGGRAWEMRTG